MESFPFDNLVVMWLGATLIAAPLAVVRGRRLRVWLPLALVVGPLALVLLILLPRAGKPRLQTDEKIIFEQGPARLTNRRLSIGFHHIDMARVDRLEVVRMGKGLFHLRLVDHFGNSSQLLKSRNQTWLLRLAEAANKAAADLQQLRQMREDASRDRLWRPGERKKQRPFAWRHANEISELNRRRRRGEISPEMYKRKRDRLLRRRE